MPIEHYGHYTTRTNTGAQEALLDNIHAGVAGEMILREQEPMFNNEDLLDHAEAEAYREVYRRRAIPLYNKNVAELEVAPDLPVMRVGQRDEL